MFVVLIYIGYILNYDMNMQLAFSFLFYFCFLIIFLDSDGLRAGRTGFDFRHCKGFSLLHSVQMGSGAHPASYTMGTGDSFSGV
jgi:hypothetical protein